MSRRRLTSTPALGSSRNSTCGSCDSAFAISSRRFIPPDSVITRLFFLSHSDRSLSTFSMCARLTGLPNRPRLNDTVFHTDSNASVVSSCGTSPISERAARYAATMSCPPTVTRPLVAVTMPQMMLISVVLPAPLGPSRPKISPRRISRSMFFSACCPEA